MVKLLHRRRFLHVAAGALALPALSRTAAALDYPTKAVRVIVPYGAGGPGDIVTRLVAQLLSGRLGQQFIIDNRPGAGGNIGTEMAVRAPADGYTLVHVGPPNAVNATLYDNLKFDFLRDIAPVGSTGRVTVVVVVNPAVPAKSVPEFIAYAKANPGTINMASPGSGTISHMAGELFKMMAGVQLTHVPYRGEAQALTDLIGGRVQVMFETTPPLYQHIQAGELRALAVASASRWDALPDLPPVRDFVPGYEASGWYGLGTPRGTPAEIIDVLNKALGESLADPTLKAKLAELGVTAAPSSAADFGKFVAEEAEKWAKVVRTANIKPE
jgi:tripartite-type tricarboxylate transporter receptor subunit TctC